MLLTRTDEETDFFKNESHEQRCQTIHGHNPTILHDFRLLRTSPPNLARALQYHSTPRNKVAPENLRKPAHMKPPACASTDVATPNMQIDEGLGSFPRACSSHHVDELASLVICLQRSDNQATPDSCHEVRAFGLLVPLGSGKDCSVRVCSVGLWQAVGGSGPAEGDLEFRMNGETSAQGNKLVCGRLAKQ